MTPQLGHTCFDFDVITDPEPSRPQAGIKVPPPFPRPSSGTHTSPGAPPAAPSKEPGK